MNSDTDQVAKQLRTLKIIAYVMLVSGPVIFLGLAFFLSIQQPPQGTPNSMIVYMLIVLAIGVPGIVPLVRRSQIQTFRSSQNSKMTPANLFFTISIMSMTFVEASYIYGLVSFLLTGEIVNMLYFYPIGIFWSFVHWPKREKYDQLVERLSRP